MSLNQGNEADYTVPPARKKFAVEGTAASVAAASSSASSSSSEVTLAAKRLAQELADYAGLQFPDNLPIIDLQLLACRKMREVRCNIR